MNFAVSAAAASPASVHWTEANEAHTACWRSEAGVAPPRRIVVVDDTLKADAALRLAGEGAALLWRGDFHNARQLLLAMARRIDRKSSRPHKSDKSNKSDKSGKPVVTPTPRDAFQLHRQAQGQRARLLGSVLVLLDADGRLALPRAPDLRAACGQTWGEPQGQPCLVALRELMGLVGAYEWRKKGVEIAALGSGPNNRIHPHYGVFSPVRGEYLDLLAQEPLPGDALAFDIGTGTGVLAAVLARHGVRHVIATDCDPRAIACARENIERLGLNGRVELLRADLFPPGRAPLVVCNPPWLPARPSAPVERAIYDEDSRMLRGFLEGLGQHLEPGGQGWLILSDLAEHLGLRTRDELLAWIAAAGLRVLGRSDVRPRHPKAGDAGDRLHAARAKEVTSLWRLAAA